jgi:ATP/maltotriose-dependent transcriptional regulator MalT
VRTRGRRALFNYEFVTLRSWFDKLGLELIDRDLELTLQAAWLEQLSGGSLRRDTFEHAAHLIATQPHQVDQQTEVLTLQAYLHLCEGDHPAAQHAAARAIAQPQPTSAFVEGHRFAMFAVTCDPNDAAAAIAAATTAAAAFALVDGVFGQIAPHGMLSDFLRRSGDVVAALRTLEKYVRAFEHTHLNFTAEAVIAHLAYAETLYWVDQIAEAKAQFQYVLRYEETPVAAPFVAPIAQLYLNLCALADGDASSVHVDPQADSAEWRQLVKTSHPSSLAKLALLRVMRDVLRNDDSAIHTTLDAAGFDLQTLPDLSFTAQLAVLFAEVHAGSRDPRIIPALQHMRTAVAPTTDFELHVRAGLLLTAHLESTENSVDAQNLLSILLPKLEQSRAHRFAIDSPALLPCLSGAGNSFTSRLILRMQANRTSSHPFHLTNREHEILQLAASGLATDEIAQRINMTCASVYTYFSRIYRKMNVRARTAALHVYRQIEI